MATFDATGRISIADQTKLTQTVFVVPQDDWTPNDGPGMLLCIDPSVGSNLWTEARDHSGVKTHPVVFGVDSATSMADTSGGSWISNATSGNGPLLDSDATQLASLKFNGSSQTLNVYSSQVTYADFWTRQTYTDLAINGTSAIQVSSAAHPFTSADAGNTLTITAGTGFNTGSYLITAVASNGTATVVSNQTASTDQSLGTVGSTSGSGYKGLAFTVAAKIKPTVDGADEVIFDNTGGMNGSNVGIWCHKYTDNYIYFTISKGGAYVLAELKSANPITNDGLWHSLVVYCDGTTPTMLLDGASSTKTFTVTNALAPTTQAQTDLRIAQDSGGGSTRYTGNIGSLIIANANWNAPAHDNGQHLARWRNYNPPYKLDGGRTRLAVNGRFASLQPAALFSQVAGTNYTGPGLLPNQVKGMFQWLDFTDATQIYTTISGSSPNVVATAGTNVSANNDAVKFVANKGPATYRRDAYASSLNPVWKTVGPPIPCVYFDNTTDSGGASVNYLTMQQWPDLAKTFFVIFQNLRTGPDNGTTSGDGSHLLSTGATVYLAMGGSAHQSASNRNQIVWHTGGSPTSSVQALNHDTQDNWHIVECLQAGAVTTCFLDGIWNATVVARAVNSAANVFLPTTIGFADPTKYGWGLHGYLAHIACFAGVLDQETRRRLRIGFMNYNPLIPWATNMNISY